MASSSEEDGMSQHHKSILWAIISVVVIGSIYAWSTISAHIEGLSVLADDLRGFESLVKRGKMAEMRFWLRPMS